MGMSNDLEAAVEEGSTMVRVGTALFGPRQRHQRAAQAN
jgi:PLP dependent protein